MNAAVLLSGIALGGLSFLAILLLPVVDPGFPGARIVPDILLLPALMLTVLGGAMDSGAVVAEREQRVHEELRGPPGA